MPRPQMDSFFEDAKPQRKPASQTRKRAVKKPQPEPQPEPQVAFQQRAVQRDWDFEEAVRCLEDILHPDERAKYASILDPYHNDDELKSRVEDWRERHGILQDNE